MVLLGVALLIAAAYSVRIIGQVWRPGSDSGVPDLSSSERLGVGVLVLAIVGLGVWPNGVLNLMAPAVQALAAAWQG